MFIRFRLRFNEYLPCSDEERDEEADELDEESIPEISVCMATLTLPILTRAFSIAISFAPGNP